MSAAEIREAYESAERDLYALTAEYEAARDAVRADFRPRLDELGEEVARLQKHMLNHEVLEALQADESDPWAALNSLRDGGWQGGPTDEEAAAVFGAEEGEDG